MDRLFEPLGLDHVVLHVKDQDASQRFYIGLLGCSLDHVNPALSLVHLRFGQAFIDLLPREPDFPATNPQAGMDHLCLSIRCEDLGKAAEVLHAQGASVEGDVVDRLGAFGRGPSLYLRDPDGYRIELKPR